MIFSILMLSSVHSNLLVFEYYCLNIIVNINPFIALNISVNNAHLEMLQQSSLNKKLKIMEESWNFFRKSYWTMKCLAQWSPELQNIFQKIYKTLQPPSYILTLHSLTMTFICIIKNRSKCYMQLRMRFINY